MTERKIASVSDLEQAIQNFRDATKHLHPMIVRLQFAPLLVDMIGHAMAEELLVELRVVLPERLAKEVVGILLDHRLTFDSTLDDGVV